MNKNILRILSLTFAAMLWCPVASATEFTPEPVAVVENETEQVQISVTNGSTVQVKFAEGMMLEVYSITGEKVYAQRVDSPSKSFEFSNLPKGCYIVKVGKVTRKVYLK